MAVTHETFCKLLKSIGIEPINVVVRQDARSVRDMIEIEGVLDYATLEKAAGILHEKELRKLFGFVPPKNETSRLLAKKILKNGDYMTVLWTDGTKTIVKRAADEVESDYAAFTAALGIKCFGSNSALKRIVASAEEQGKKKKKKKEEVKPNKVEKAFDNVGKAFCKSAVALIEEMAKLREDEYEQQKTDEWLDGIEKKQNDNRS